MIKFLSKKLALVVLLSFLNINFASAAEVNSVDPSTDGKLSLIKCIDKGNLDFLAFLRASSFSDGFSEGFLEPWGDIIYRNQCHSIDVYGLIKQQDQVRTAIRDSFLTCQTQKLPQLKKAFARLNAEIYYVRHVVDASAIARLPSVITEEFRENLYTDRNDLYSEMAARYIGPDALTERELDIFFIGLEAKYEDRKASYITCEKSSWETVATKWEEFMEFFAEEGAGLKKAGESISANADKLAEEFTTIKTVEIFTGEEGIADYLSSFAKVTLNGLPAKEGFGEINDYLVEQYGGDSGNLSIGGLMNAKSSSDIIYDVDAMSASMKSNFAAQYLVAGDQSVELFMDNLDGRASTQTEGLVEILEGTSDPLHRFLLKTETMSDRQCSES